MKQNPGRLITLPKKDEVPKKSKTSDKSEEQNRKQWRLVDLHRYLKTDVWVMLTTNINVENPLINEPIGGCAKFRNDKKEARTIYFELNYKPAGQIRLCGSDVIAKNYK